MEKEFTTPLGIALRYSQPCDVPCTTEASLHNSRGEDTGEDQEGFGINEAPLDLRFVERLVLDPGLVASDSLDRDKALAVVEEGGVRGRVREDEPDGEGPNTGRSSKLGKTSASHGTNMMRRRVDSGVTYDVEDQLPSLRLEINRQLRDAHRDVGADDAAPSE